MDVDTPNEGTRDRLLVEVILAGGQLASGHTEQGGERRRGGEERGRRRVVLAPGAGRVATVRAPLTLLVPPLTIEGVAHVAPGVGRLRADPEIFAHFFSMTNATIHFPDGPTLEALPVALVNREAVAAARPVERAP